MALSREERIKRRKELEEAARSQADNVVKDFADEKKKKAPLPKEESSAKAGKKPAVSKKTVTKKATQKAQVVQEVHEEQEVQENREIGTTQGKKGQHAKRINMAFSDMNHEYITKESRRRGLSATVFVNQIIDEYKKSDKGRIEI